MDSNAGTTDTIALLTGVGGFITGSISLAISIREKKRNIKVALKWGIDPEYERTSGLVLWTYITNPGYQPVIINSAQTYIQGIPSPQIAAKPLIRNQFPLQLNTGQTFTTSTSGEVIIEMFARANRQGNSFARESVDTVFGRYKSPWIIIQQERLRELIALVKGNSNYSDYKNFLRSIGGLHFNSFNSFANSVEGIVNHGFEVRRIPELDEVPQEQPDL